MSRKDFSYNIHKKLGKQNVYYVTPLKEIKKYSKIQECSKIIVSIMLNFHDSGRKCKKLLSLKLEKY